MNDKVCPGGSDEKSGVRKAVANYKAPILRFYSVDEKMRRFDVRIGRRSAIVHDREVNLQSLDFGQAENWLLNADSGPQFGGFGWCLANNAIVRVSMPASLYIGCPLLNDNTGETTNHVLTIHVPEVRACVRTEVRAGWRREDRGRMMRRLENVVSHSFKGPPLKNCRSD